jgi:uncharacterized protein (DUF1330 family)
METSMLRTIIVAAAVVSASLMGFDHSAVARGGHGGFHGGGFYGGGMRGGGFRGPAGGMPPAYVVIDVSATNDAQAFKTTMADTAAGLVPFGGHLMIDADNPTALDGAAPQHLVIIAFDTLEHAQAWKDSESFKRFDADRGRAVTSRTFMVEGVPNAAPLSGLRGGGHGMRFDPKPFEEIIKKRDQDLNRIKDICKGC